MRVLVCTLVFLALAGCAANPARARSAAAPEKVKTARRVAKAPAGKPCPFVDPLLDPRAIHGINCVELQTDCHLMVVHEGDTKNEPEPCP